MKIKKELDKSMLHVSRCTSVLLLQKQGDSSAQSGSQFMCGMAAAVPLFWFLLEIWTKIKGQHNEGRGPPKTSERFPS